MPAASWRTSPARTMSLWLMASASAGSSRSVGMRERVQRMGLGSSEGGSAPLPKPPPDAVRAGGRRGAGAPPSEASNLRIAPAKPPLEAEHSCSRGHGNDFGNLLGDARDLVGSGHARIVEQALDGSAAQDVRLGD